MGKQLPKKWVSVSLKEITKNVKGKKPKIQSEVEFDGSVPYMDIKALEYNEIRQFADIESSKLFEEGDVAMVWDGARSGWVSKTNFGAIGSTLVAFKPIKINSNYLYYYLLEKYPFINSNARGVGIPHVDPTVLWSLDFPLPPLAEQNRIVAKLDVLFAQLETIKASMEKIPVLLKDFRQQVLTQAVTGKLTEEWRKGKELGEWKEVSITEITELNPKYSIEDETEVSFVPMANMNNGLFYKMILDTKKFREVKSGYKRFKNDDVLLAKITPCFENGKAGIASNLTNNFGCGSSEYYVFKCNSEILPYYLLMNFKRNEFLSEGAKNMSGSVGHKRVTKEFIENYTINLPSFNEQQEIVRRVESLFVKADTIEKQYKNLKEKIDTLPQALLHKAFKGELTEQLDSDGDARELLQQIQELKNTVIKTKKATTKKVKNYTENEGVLGMVAEGK